MTIFCPPPFIKAPSGGGDAFTLTAGNFAGFIIGYNTTSNSSLPIDFGSTTGTLVPGFPLWAFYTGSTPRLIVGGNAISYLNGKTLSVVGFTPMLLDAITMMNYDDNVAGGTEVQLDGTDISFVDGLTYAASIA